MMSFTSNRVVDGTGDALMAELRMRDGDVPPAESWMGEVMFLLDSHEWEG